MSGLRVFRRVLVANRGEIAVRVIGTCRRLGIETVLTVSEADVGSRPARLADAVIRIGASRSIEPRITRLGPNGSPSSSSRWR